MRRLIGAAACGYLLGSVSFADLISRRAAHAVDLRVAGSGNPGALNARRVLGRRAGSAVLAGDVAKGMVASFLGRALAGTGGAHVGAVAAVTGHCYPFSAGFRGGAGVATSFGQCLATFPSFAPLDVVIAGGIARAPGLSRPALVSAAFSSIAWTIAGVVWWRRGWPNLWGPAPTIHLPLANAATTAVLASKALAGMRRRAPDELLIDR